MQLPVFIVDFRRLDDYARSLLRAFRGKCRRLVSFSNGRRLQLLGVIEKQSKGEAMVRTRTLVVLGMALSVGVAARADIIAHNGSAASNPLSADATLLSGAFSANEVDVDLFSSAGDFSDVERIFNENATHKLEFELASGDLPLSAFESITNNTGTVWTGFRVRLQFVEFVSSQEGSTPAPLPDEVFIDDLNFASFSGDPFLDFDSTVTITRFADPLDGVEIEFAFGGSGLTDGDGFSLDYFIGFALDNAGDPIDFGINGFLMEEEPLTAQVIPAPSAASLCLVGLSCFSWIRRRTV